MTGIENVTWLTFTLSRSVLACVLRRLMRNTQLHLQGSSLLLTDLERAGIATAFALVIMNKVEGSQRGQYFADDAATILAMRLVNEQYPAVKTVAEVNFNGYIRHLSRAPDQASSAEQVVKISSTEKDEDDYFCQPAYAAGEVLGALFLQTLLCQAFFNPFIIPVIRAMVLHPSDDDSASIQAEVPSCVQLSAIPPHLAVRVSPALQTSTSGAGTSTCAAQSMEWRQGPFLG